MPNKKFTDYSETKTNNVISIIYKLIKNGELDLSKWTQKSKDERLYFAKSYVGLYNITLFLIMVDQLANVHDEDIVHKKLIEVLFDINGENLDKTIIKLNLVRDIWIDEGLTTFKILDKWNSLSNERMITIKVLLDAHTTCANKAKSSNINFENLNELIVNISEKYADFNGNRIGMFILDSLYNSKTKITIIKNN